MKALSIRQPWASMIVSRVPIIGLEPIDEQSSRAMLRGFVLKDVENRTWPTQYRGRIYVHAGKRQDDSAMYWLMEHGITPIVALGMYNKQIPRGAIIGEVDIVDCVTESKSPWFTGPYGYVLANPVVYKEPIACKGQQGFFEPMWGKR